MVANLFGVTIVADQGQQQPERGAAGAMVPAGAWLSAFRLDALTAAKAQVAGWARPIRRAAPTHGLSRRAQTGPLAHGWRSGIGGSNSGPVQRFTSLRAGAAKLRAPC